MATCAVIRKYLCINKTVDTSADRSEYANKRNKPNNNWHFWNHQKQAFSALGLDWYSVNE